MGQIIDLTGKIFGRLTVLNEERRDGKNIFWRCLCSCGTEKIISGGSLRNGKTRSCGCLNREMSRQKNMIDLAGMRFGRLLVLELYGYKKKGVGGSLYWRCVCDCGKEKNISGNALRSGGVVSCGCYNAEKTSKMFLSDYINKRFGNLVVIKRAEKPKGKSTGSYWECLCDCGNKVIKTQSSLKSGRAISCGCVKKEPGTKTTQYGETAFKCLYRRYKNDAKNRDVGFNLSTDEFRYLTKQKCFYCGCEPSQICSEESYNGEYIYNGIDRIDNNKEYDLDNVVSCCKSCNFAKRNMTLEEYASFIARSYSCMTFTGIIK